MDAVGYILLAGLTGIPILIGLSEAGDEVPGVGLVTVKKAPMILWVIASLTAVFYFIHQ